ncbi:hypothetical protein [Sediminispirochaeta smaragdinae]|uniref:Nitrogen regulatory protein P-II n=1 Tax=Sediminispirochaeta smaragdinae (strain DSM 11293 / JCM 15392 / SEBR 4228) TaxID=573413 RepID=E1R9A2_SEDSS|nr:hypothetical protein [Sediminispirochaeta smaragdinae]ADK83071.1 hypothetical protein Spirs_3986 [Sediminispirochaeta smaragdinae DSM 11293]
MYYMILEVADSDLKEDIFLALQSIGITHASTFDGQDISGALSDELNLFSGFFRGDKIERGELMVITAQVRTREQVRDLLTNLREAEIDIDRQDIINLTLIPAVMTFSSHHGFFEEGDS